MLIFRTTYQLIGGFLSRFKEARQIEVQSERGKGSTFSVFIPANFTQT
jgi:hypothetical protein